jgi:hypothetical protein
VPSIVTLAVTTFLRRGRDRKRKYDAEDGQLAKDLRWNEPAGNHARRRKSEAFRRLRPTCRHANESPDRVVITRCHVALSSDLSFIRRRVVADNAPSKCTGRPRIAWQALRRVGRSCVEPHEGHIWVPTTGLCGIALSVEGLRKSDSEFRIAMFRLNRPRRVNAVMSNTRVDFIDKTGRDSTSLRWTA